MSKKIQVDLLEFHRIKNAIDEMQGHVFFIQDNEGILRRWNPPEVFPHNKQENV